MEVIKLVGRYLNLTAAKIKLIIYLEINYLWYPGFFGGRGCAWLTQRAGWRLHVFVLSAQKWVQISQPVWRHTYP